MSYKPHGRKTEHFGPSEVIVHGARFLEVLQPWLDLDPMSYCFLPTETSTWHYRRLRRRESSKDGIERVR